MAEHRENAEVPRTKEDMLQRLSADSSRAFLDDIKPELTQAKVQAQSEWWQNLNKDNQAPAVLHMSELPELQRQGWELKPDQYYNKLSRQLKDGTKEEDTYDNRSGERLNTRFARNSEKDAEESGKKAQIIDVMYRDGKNVLGVSVKSGYFESEFRASFNEQGKLTSAYEWGKDKDSMTYSFRQDGSLYEALRRSRTNSEVVNDQIFNKSGQPTSDYNPLYLYEKAKRPIQNLYMGLRELSRSGGIL